MSDPKPAPAKVYHANGSLAGVLTWGGSDIAWYDYRAPDGTWCDAQGHSLFVDITGSVFGFGCSCDPGTGYDRQVQLFDEKGREL